MPSFTAEPTILDSVTHLDTKHKGTVAYCGSHAGIYAAYYAASKGIAAVILNDAGIGRERAGIAGLTLLEKLGVAGAAISHLSARIGDGQDGVKRGVLSTVNGPASKLGLKPGMTTKDALTLLLKTAPGPSPKPEPLAESRFAVSEASRGGVNVIVGLSVGPGVGLTVGVSCGVSVSKNSARAVMIAVSMVRFVSPPGWKTTSSGGLKK